MRSNSLWLNVRWGVLVCVFLAVFNVPAGAQQPLKPLGPPKSTDSKDVAPIILDLDVGGNQSVGGGIVATFLVMARRSLDPVKIEIVLPEGIQKTAGELTWQGPMGPGEVRIVEISAQLSSSGSKRFLGRVTLPAAAGGAPQVLTVERTWDVQPGPAVKPKK